MNPFVVGQKVRWKHDSVGDYYTVRAIGGMTRELIQIHRDGWYHHQQFDPMESLIKIERIGEKWLIDYSTVPDYHKYSKDFKIGDEVIIGCLLHIVVEYEYHADGYRYYKVNDIENSFSDKELLPLHKMNLSYTLRFNVRDLVKLSEETDKLSIASYYFANNIRYYKLSNGLLVVDSNIKMWKDAIEPKFKVGDIISYKNNIYIIRHMAINSYTVGEQGRLNGSILFENQDLYTKVDPVLVTDNPQSLRKLLIKCGCEGYFIQMDGGFYTVNSTVKQYLEFFTLGLTLNKKG